MIMCKLNMYIFGEYLGRLLEGWFGLDWVYLDGFGGDI
jgi:hypothetical protein